VEGEDNEEGEEGGKMSLEERRFVDFLVLRVWYLWMIVAGISIFFVGVKVCGCSDLEVWKLEAKKKKENEHKRTKRDWEKNVGNKGWRMV
jgi:hypothetical protein